MSAEQVPEAAAPPQSPGAAPWFPPPTYPPPQAPPSIRRRDAITTWSGVAGGVGILLALATGLGGLILGPIAYFLGKAAVKRIDESKGELTGRGAAATGWVLGLIATIVGALVSLFWIVVILEALSTPST